jgi:hypothetical protein
MAGGRGGVRLFPFFSIGEISFLFTAENLIKAQALKMLVSERRESLEHHP